MKKLLLLGITLTIVLTAILVFALPSNAAIATTQWGDNLTGELDTATDELTIFGSDVEVICLGDAEEPVEELEFTLSDDGTYYVVTGINPGVGSGVVVIPEEYNGLPVKEIGISAFEHYWITSATIPNSITKIDSFAFYEGRFTSVTIPDSVTYMGDSIFGDCDNLVDITIPSGITHIGWQMFYSCDSLTSITLPESIVSIDYEAFWDCVNLSTITFNGTTAQWEAISKGENWDQMWDSDKNVYRTIDYEVICLGDEEEPVEELEFTLSDDETYYIVTGIGTFTGTDLVIPSEYRGLPVKELGVTAFCESDIVRVEIPASITNIGKMCFAYCANLEEVAFAPNSNLESLGPITFNFCPKLKTFTVPKSVIDLGTETFYGSGIESFKFEEGSQITFFSEALSNMFYTVKEIYIPASVKEFGDMAFRSTSIETIYFEGTTEQWNSMIWGHNAKPVYVGEVICLGDEEEPVEELEFALSDDETYYIVTGIGTFTGTDVVIPEEYNGVPVWEIGDNAFEGNEKITSLELHDEIRRIGKKAFHKCKNLSGEITVRKGVVCSAAFSATNINVITLGKKSSSAARTFRLLANDDSIVIEEGAFSECFALETVVIGNNVTSIGQNAFAGCTALSELTVGNGVSHMDETAFNDCNIKTVRFYSTTQKEAYQSIIKAEETQCSCADGVHMGIGEFVPAIDSTCATNGAIAHYLCTSCEKALDENGNEILDITIEKLPHKDTDISGKCDDCGKAYSGVYCYDDGFYCFEWNGVIRTGKIYVTQNASNGLVSAGWYYTDESGRFYNNEFVTVGDYIYYFVNGKGTSNGVQKIDGKLYCFDSHGRVRKNENGNRIYVTEASSNEKVGAGWYYTGDDGHFYNEEFVKIGEHTYYFINGRGISNGVHEIGGKLYCFDSLGRVRKNEIGKGNYSHGKAIWVNDFNEYELDGNGWYYINEDGSFCHNQFVTIGETTYYFINGRGISNGVHEIGGKLYCFDSYGRLRKNENGQRIYITLSSSNGIVKNGWHYTDEDGSIK